MLLQRALGTARGAAGRIVHPARNQELVQYQARLRETRKALIDAGKGAPSKAQARASASAAAKAAADARWAEHLDEVQTRITRDTSMASQHARAQKHHPCRPTVDHAKDEATRREGARRLAQALRPGLVMRRKYVHVLGQSLSTDHITHENVEVKVAFAIAHPATYNVAPDRMVAERAQLHARLRELRVPSDTDEGQ